MNYTMTHAEVLGNLLRALHVPLLSSGVIFLLQVRFFLRVRRRKAFLCLAAEKETTIKYKIILERYKKLVTFSLKEEIKPRRSCCLQRHKTNLDVCQKRIERARDRISAEESFVAERGKENIHKQRWIGTKRQFRLLHAKSILC